MRILLGLLLASLTAAADDPLKVLVWDERQPRQAEAYDNFLGNEIGERLRALPGLEVVSVGQDDPGFGLGALDSQHVLLWWGHVRQGEIPVEVGRRIVERVRSGRLALVALHSAHWSVPFMEAMFSRTREDARRRFPDPQTEIEFVPPAGRLPPTYDSIVTPAYYALKRGGRVSQVRVDLPNCVFPGVDAHGRPSQVTVTMPDHPIMEGSPRSSRFRAARCTTSLSTCPSRTKCCFARTGGVGGGSAAAWFGTSGKARSSTSGPATRPSRCSRIRT